MNIICCYVNNKLSLDALESFAVYAPGVRMVNCTGDWGSRQAMTDSMTLYWHAFRESWQGKDDVLLLKQRLALKVDTIPALESCPGVLCIQDGHVRYRKKLQEAVPHCDIGGDYIVWHLLEGRLRKLWEIHRIPVCRHQV